MAHDGERLLQIPRDGTSGERVVETREPDILGRSKGERTANGQRANSDNATIRLPREYATSVP